MVMRNRLSAVTSDESERLSVSKSNDWSTLKNKFSGERLFKYSYFKLICGDFSDLEKNKNKWLLEQILDKCSKGDISLLPVLKKIASDISLDKGIRQRSAEILENEEIKNLSEPEGNATDIKYEKGKLISVGKILAGNRIPQTTEILRLLKDKSIESKRLGIFIIGKFRLTAMLPEVCDCLNIQGLEEDTVAVLRIFGNEASDELRRFYLKSSGNTNTSIAIIRLLSKIKTKDNISFIFERLWSTSRQVREVVLDCLISSGFKAPEEDERRLNLMISEVIGILSWLLSAKICLWKSNQKFHFEIADKEYKRWKQFLLKVHTIKYSTDDSAEARNNSKVTETDDKRISEMINIIFGEKRVPFKGVIPDIKNDVKKLKKLHRFFPGKIPDFYELAEDIINCDYNTVSIWTKACTLRNLPAIKDANLADSVTALLFSPEEILQEEAVKLAARSNNEFYKSVSQRIPEKTKSRLDRIISGENEEKELLFEKTRFLSSVFKGIPEEELLVLAGELKYVKNIDDKFYESADRCIIWINLPGKIDPEVIIKNNEIQGNSDYKRFSDKNINCYVLELRTVEAFHNLYPERSFKVLKYIDEHEE